MAKNKSIPTTPPKSKDDLKHLIPLQDVTIWHSNPEIKVSEVCKRVSCSGEKLTVACRKLGIAIRNQKISESDIETLKHYFSMFTSISKIEIKGLWGTHDFVWDLDSSVNILIGDNGSGKSTILNLVNAIINEGPTQKDDLIKYSYHFDEVLLTLNNSRRLLFKKVSNNADFTENYTDNELESGKKIRKDAEKYLKPLSLHHVRVEVTSLGAGYYASDAPFKKNFKEIIKVNRISTFDNFVKDARTSNFIASIGNVETDLDWDLRQLMSSFKSYQLVVTQQESAARQPLDAKISEISKKTSADINELQTLQQILLEKENIKTAYHALENKLFDTLTELFNNNDSPELSKIIDKDSDNDFIFIKNNTQKIPLHQLSSGEKQLLIILMSVVLQEEKPCILLLDEPEISLHVRWQEDFIDKILLLNPNVQIIMATHGSRMFVKHNWFQKTVKIQSLTHQIPFKK